MKTFEDKEPRDAPEFYITSCSPVVVCGKPLKRLSVTVVRLELDHVTVMLLENAEISLLRMAQQPGRVQKLQILMGSRLNRKVNQWLDRRRLLLDTDTDNVHELLFI